MYFLQCPPAEHTRYEGHAHAHATDVVSDGVGRASASASAGSSNKRVKVSAATSTSTATPAQAQVPASAALLRCQAVILMLWQHRCVRVCRDPLDRTCILFRRGAAIILKFELFLFKSPPLSYGRLSELVQSSSRDKCVSSPTNSSISNGEFPR